MKTVEEFGKALNANKPEGEISDDDAGSVAGGVLWWLERDAFLLSI